jgi:hypothetical protein
MTLQLATSNVVVLAHHFNPTITDQIWLSKNQIVREGEMDGSFIFADMITQVQTKLFHLLIVPDKCQFTPADSGQGQQALIRERVGMLVNNLPHTPYKAVGMNFVWHLVPEGSSIPEISRRLFFLKGHPLHQLFDVDNARFGAYLSKDSLGCRLKVDVKPLHAEKTDGSKLELIQFECNYHRDIGESEDGVDVILHQLAQWTSAREDSEVIAHTAAQGVK